MIKKLRIKLILITMISVIGVLAIIMTSINVSNYYSTTNDIDRIVDRLVEHGGSFDDFKPDAATADASTIPPIPSDTSSTAQKKDFNDDGIDNGMGRETAFETRFFTVKYEGNNTTVDLKNISIDEEEALSLASAVRNKSRGYKNNYRYRVINEENVTTVYFVDAETRLNQLQRFAWLSILISFGSALIVFVIIFLLSKRIVKPISDAYERQKRFITNAAHELKTPLTIISANNEMMELTSGENELTVGINKQIVRMNNMVKNLSALSKIDEKNNVIRTSFNIVETLDDMLENFKEHFEEKNIEIKKEFSDELPYSGDEGLIRQLFSILLDNVLKYAKTNLLVKATVQNGKITISFINDAVKINEGNLDRCFERFYRFDESRASQIEGSGIGLSIAKEIVILHNGDIHAYGHDNNVFEIKITL